MQPCPQTGIAHWCTHAAHTALTAIPASEVTSLWPDSFGEPNLDVFPASSVAKSSFVGYYCKRAEQSFRPHGLVPTAHSAFILWPPQLSRMTSKITWKYPARFWSCRSWGIRINQPNVLFSASSRIELKVLSWSKFLKQEYGGPVRIKVIIWLQKKN